MNLVRAIQEAAAGIVSTDDCRWLCEDSNSIEFEVKDAMAKTGIAPVVVVTQLDYQGHNGDLEFYDVSLELQVAENPPVSRFCKNGKSAYDVALGALHRLCGPNSGVFGSFCPGSVVQQVEDGLVVVRAEAVGTYAWRERPGWIATGTYAGRYSYAGETSGKTTYRGPAATLEISRQPSGWVFDLSAPEEQISFGYIGQEMPSTVVLEGPTSRTAFTYEGATT